MMPLSRSFIRTRRIQVAPQRGMTLVELMVTVSIAGILAATATASFNKQIHQARSVEAVEMLGAMKNAVSAVAALDTPSNSDLDFSTNSFGKGGSSKGSDKGSDKENKDAELDNDGDNGHGNSDGCDPSNPSGKCPGKKDKDSGEADESDSGSKGKENKDSELDNDGNNGHGNNEGKCDPSNPSGNKDCDPDEADDSGSDSDDAGTDDSEDDPGTGTDDGSDTDAGGDEDDASTSGSTGGGGKGIERLCGSAQPVPSSVEMVSGKVFLASPSSWESGSADEGWRCLQVSRAGTQRYQFGYDLGAGTVEGATEGYTAWARGDLDGDGRTSLFRLRGELINGQVVHAPGVEMIDSTE